MSDPPRLQARPQNRKPVFAVVLIAVVIASAVLVLLIALFYLESHMFSDGSRTPGNPPSPADFGTVREVGTHGDDPNPGALFHGAYPSRAQTQERRIGGRPARFSGYTTWIRSIVRVPARTLVHAYPGGYLRVRVTVFNRDTQSQGVCACDFYVYSRRYGLREADAVRAPTVGVERDVKSGAKLDGNVYLYVGKAAGPLFVVYDPDGDGTGYNGDVTADAVWKVPTAVG
jgi:hypothetical protein